MNENDWNKVFRYAEKWILEASDKIKASFTSDVHIEYKTSPSDLVTNMDRGIEKFFAQQIKSVFPDHYILGEEGFGDDIQDTSGTIWIVDPIDGTTNFVHQKRHFTISVAVYDQGIGKVGLILDVVSGDLYHCIRGKGAFLNDTIISPIRNARVEESLVGMNATWITENRRINPNILSPLVKNSRGTRSYGSAALELAYVATGLLDTYITMRLSPWDYAAGILLIEEVGGKCTDIYGKPIEFLSKTSILASNPISHDQILKEYILKEN